MASPSGTGGFHGPKFCPNTEPHVRHEWIDGAIRRECPGIPSGTGGEIRVYVPDWPVDIEVWADPAELRRAYERDLRDDGMFDAPDDKLIRHVYEMNPDAPELRVEDES